MIIITKEQALSVHNLIIKKFGGARGIRNEGGLESALVAPFQYAFGELVHKTPVDQAAALCRGLIQNHPFVDGNKRMGVTLLLTYLKLVNIKIVASNDDVIELGINVATGKDLDYIKLWIKKRITE